MALAQLTDDEAHALSEIVESGPLASRVTLADAAHDSLIANGYVRWVGGVLVATIEGIAALADHSKAAPEKRRA